MILSSDIIVFSYLLFGFLLLVCGFITFHQTHFRKTERIGKTALYFGLGGLFFNAAFKIYLEYENIFTETTYLNSIAVVVLVMMLTYKGEKEEKAKSKNEQ